MASTRVLLRGLPQDGPVSYHGKLCYDASHPGVVSYMETVRGEGKPPNEPFTLDEPTPTELSPQVLDKWTDAMKQATPASKPDGGGAL